MQGFPSQSFLDFEYKMVHLSDEEYQFMQACYQPESSQTVGSILDHCQLDLAGVRSLWQRQLIIFRYLGISNSRFKARAIVLALQAVA